MIKNKNIKTNKDQIIDAIIFGIGLEKNNIQANMSYDINTSDLNIASKDMAIMISTFAPTSTNFSC